MNISPRLFPTLLIVLNVAAAVVYAVGPVPEWRKAVYWMAAAILTFTVTW